MDKKGAKGYWISTAKIINQQLFDEYVEKVRPWLKENGGEVFAKDTDPRGKEKTEHKGLEQDKKTGYYTHKAPKDRLDTERGRIHLAASKATGPAKFAKIPPRPKSNDMSYKERKKEIAKNKKEAKRKDDFDKKHKVGKHKDKK